MCDISRMFLPPLPISKLIDHIDYIVKVAGIDHAVDIARAALLAAHRSAEPGHARVLGALDLEPYLDLGLRLGEGTGAALCIGLARAAVGVLTGMATFKSAGVSDRPHLPGARS